MTTANCLRTAIALLCFMIGSGALAHDGPERRTIEVTGSGEVSAPPDLVIVAFAVETATTEAGTAVKQNAEKSAKVAAAIKGRLGPSDQMNTTRYSLEPRYNYEQPVERNRNPNAPPTITGYIARNEVRVVSHVLDNVGQLIDAAISAGANRVSQLEFTREDHNPLLRDALAKAGSEAHAQAESIAKALGVRIKQVVTATTSQEPIFMPRKMEGRAMAMADAATTPVEPGEVKVNASLRVTYEIE